ncbi:MAG: AMP-dependent synthetase/ligase [bacterium]
METVEVKYSNLVEMLEDAVRRYADRSLYATKRNGVYEWTSYQEFAELVDQLRGGLATLEVAPEDRVAVISKNTLQWAVGAYATYGLKGQYVPMYETQLVQEWEYIVRDSGATVLLVSNSNIYEQVKHFPEAISDLKHVVLLDGDSAPLNWSGLLQAGKENPVPAQYPEADSPMGMIYTSGTTGAPKGVVISHRNMLFEVASGLTVLRLGWGEAGLNSLCFLPWAHIFGQVVEVHALIQEGGAAALVDDVNTLVEELSIVKPTVFFAVPRVYNRIYDRLRAQMQEKPAPIRALFYAGLARAKREREGEVLGGLDKLLLGLARKIIFSKVQQRFGGNLKMAVSGASALSAEVAEFVNDLGIDVYEGYGLSENTAALTVNYRGNRKFGTVGKPLPGVRVEIDRSVEGSVEGDGEVIAYGDNVMLGYHNLPDKTREVLMPDGGLRTGDLGRFDEDGYLYITGRVKEQFKLENGKYVAPAPLEESLKLSPFINQAMICGLGRPHTVALLVVEVPYVQSYAERHNISGTDAELLQNDVILQRIERDIQRFGANYRSYEVPRKFKLLTEEWSIDNGMLTPTLKLKRNVVEERFRGEIDSMY